MPTELSATQAERRRAQEACEQMGKRITELELKIDKAKSWARLQIEHPGCLPDAKALLEMLEK